MNGTLLDDFPSASSTGPNCSASSSVNVFLSTGAIFAVLAMRSWPNRSFFPQRFSDSVQSSDNTGCPSCQRRPSRSVNVYFMPSDDTVVRSTICGLICKFSSVPNKVSYTR